VTNAKLVFQCGSAAPKVRAGMALVFPLLWRHSPPRRLRPGGTAMFPISCGPGLSCFSSGSVAWVKPTNIRAAAESLGFHPRHGLRLRPAGWFSRQDDLCHGASSRPVADIAASAYQGVANKMNGYVGAFARSIQRPRVHIRELRDDGLIPIRVSRAVVSGSARKDSATAVAKKLKKMKDAMRYESRSKRDATF